MKFWKKHLMQVWKVEVGDRISFGGMVYRVYDNLPGPAILQNQHLTLQSVGGDLNNLVTIMLKFDTKVVVYKPE